MSELVRVWATADAFEGEMMRGRLEAEGLHVLVKGDGEGPYRAGPVYLFVPREHEATAREVIDAIASGAYAEEVDAAFDETEAGTTEPRAT
ncbi:MAG TPA: hypothetical protein VLA82_14390 [Actinomycetota bacterium]|nr:hypothetical protein [Actinomycetota bacterium]